MSSTRSWTTRSNPLAGISAAEGQEAKCWQQRGVAARSVAPAGMRLANGSRRMTPVQCEEFVNEATLAVKQKRIARPASSGLLRQEREFDPMTSDRLDGGGDAYVGK